MTSTAIAHRHVLREPRATWREALAALRKSIWAISLPVFVLGGMYAGVFTATEAAAAGAALALVDRRAWSTATSACARSGIRPIDACRVSAMLFMILAGAAVFGHVLTKLRIPQQIVEAVIAADIGVTGFLIVDDGADLRARHVPRVDLDHPDHDAGDPAGDGPAAHQSGLVRHAARRSTSSSRRSRRRSA